MSKFTPVPGKAFIRAKPLFGGIVNGIHIPEKQQQALTHIGEVVAANFRKVDRSFLGIEQLMTGDRVIFAGHLMTKRLEGEEDVFILPLTYLTKHDGCSTREAGILAIVPKGLDVDGCVSGNERCKFCGPAMKESNSGGQGVLFQDGRCPRCKKDRYGQLPRDVSVSDDEAMDHFNQIAVKTHGKEIDVWDI